MDARSLSRESFQSYPPLAQRLACDHLGLLRDLPIVLCAVMLREIINFDVRFPRERAAIESRLAYLESLSPNDRRALTKGFAEFSLSPELMSADWVHAPERFEEELSAHLWASKQFDTFRTVATTFAEQVDKSIPPWLPGAHRWVVVVLGPELRKDNYPLFRKLRSHGVFFPTVDGENGMSAILAELGTRASNKSVAYSHWYIDGGNPEGKLHDAVCQFSWADSADLRAEVLKEVERVVNSGSGGPEMLRSVMATWQPKSLQSLTGDPLVERFVLSIYGEGSGTQVFSTTFVQWSARELLRRAEPVSIVARFGPRQKQRTLNEMFSKTSSEIVVDPGGSLVDADFGAYSTWVNLNRLPGSEQARFIAWSQAYGQAIAIGPDCPRGTEAPDKVDMSDLLRI